MATNTPATSSTSATSVGDVSIVRVDVITKVPKRLETAAEIPGWKWTMTLLLRAQGVMGVVDGTKQELGASATEEERQDFEKLNCRALLLISANVEANQMAYIMPHRLAKDAWTELHRIYQQNNLAFQFYLRSKWECLRQEGGETVQEYAKRTRLLLLELSAGQIQVSPEEAILKLLRGVQPKFRHVATTLQFSGQQLTMDIVEASLRAAELQEETEEGDTVEPKAFWTRAGKHKETRRCFFCNKQGHIKKDCPSYKKQQEEAHDVDPKKETERTYFVY